MTEHFSRVTLTEQELADLIDREARDRLNMTGIEFTERYLQGTLEDSPAVRDIAMLVQLGKDTDRPPISQRLRGVPKRNPQ